MVIGIEAAHANKKERTGVEGYCFFLIQALKKTIPATETVILYSNKPLIDELKDLPPNWKVKILHWPFGKFWNQIRLSIHFLFHKNPDVFFSPGQIVPLICPKVTVTMIHDSAFLVYPGAYGMLSRTYLKWMNKQIIKKSTLLITSTEFNKNELGRLYGLNVAKRVAVIPIAFQPLVVPANFNEKELGVTKKYIISVGRLETKKNTRQIIEAFTIIKKSVDLQLVLVGNPGVGYHHIKKAIKQCPYKEDIITFNFLEKEKLAGLMKNAGVFVFPSLYEGFGLPLLEAFSLGVPTVSPNIEALKEIGHGAACYVDPLDNNSLAEAVIKIINNTGEQIKYSQEGKERAAFFSWEKTAKETWSAIANLH